MICLHTPRILIRDHRMADLPSHHALLSDEKAMYYLPDLATHCLQESRENLEKAVADIKNPRRKHYFLRLEEAASGAHIGEMGYTVVDFTPLGKLVGMGYFLRPEYWGKGFATEALGEIIRFAFEENDVYRISTGCLKENAGSERVMQKCGMTKEGEFLSHTWHDGSMKDRVEYRLLKSEWKPSPTR